MMRIIECNRCHKSKRIDSVTEAGYINMDWRDVKTGDLKGDQTFDDWDLCKECMAEIKEFIRMKPAVTATIRKKEDCRDLIRQLASEGKNLKEIMELTGKSEPTVRKYMKEAESDS